MPYEEDILAHGASPKSWLRYIDFKKHAPVAEIYYLFERALLYLPGSYKIWKRYLDARKLEVCSKKLFFGREAAETNDCFERSLIFLNKMPRIWLEYGDFLMHQNRIELARKTYNRALTSLPILQHERIWQKYLEFATHPHVPAPIGYLVVRRFVQLDPSKAELLVDFCVKKALFNEAAAHLAKIVAMPAFESMHAKTTFQLLRELCVLICEHAAAIESIDVEAILKVGIRKMKAEHGFLWCSLANYFILRGNFHKARDIFQEALGSIQSAQDFSQVFEAYYKFEDSLLEAYLNANTAGVEVDELEVELVSMRMERLLDDRKRLLSDVCIRRNPNVVAEWERRVKLFAADRTAKRAIYEEAFLAIQPQRAHGKLQNLWIAYANWTLDECADYAAAKEIFARAIHVNFKNVTDLAEVYVAYAKLEMRHTKSLASAIDILSKATAPPPSSKKKAASAAAAHLEDSVHARLHTSLPLWLFLLDVLEMAEIEGAICAAYDQIIDLKICTCETIVNYACYFERNGRMEQSFQVYERGIALFGYPVAFELWNVYLMKFISHYGGQKLERARDLFEQALVDAPPKFARLLFIAYGDVEERYGLARNAIKIYDRAAKSALLDEKHDAYLFYVARAAELFGITSTREVFEIAINVLPDRSAKEFCLMYAEIECRLQEIERARLILMHGCQFANPQIDAEYWKRWNAFEISYGNEDSYREMLRLKRSIEAKFAAEISFERPAASFSVIDAPEFVPASVTTD